MARNKKSAAMARMINRDFDPSLKITDEDNALQSKKYGSAIPAKGRDFHRILSILNSHMRRIDPSLPREVSPAHYNTIAKILEIAHRNNDELGMGKCPICRKTVEPKCFCAECNTPIEILIPNPQLEKNTLAANEIMFDRMVPKLATQTTNINIQNTFINLTAGIANIITDYVPVEKRQACGVKIRALIESHKNASENNPI